MRSILTLLAFAFCFGLQAQDTLALTTADIKAWPGAAGGARNATGGRGQTVYRVTSTSGTSTATGTIRDAVSQSDRYIEFDIPGGTINLGSNPLYVYGSNLTIAGETAPGGGICLYTGMVEFRGSNVIVRNIRIRPGDAQLNKDRDALRILSNGNNLSNLAFGNITASWADDEVVSIEASTGSVDGVTFQDCIIANGFRGAKGSLVWGENATNISYIRVFLTANNDRNVRSSKIGAEWEMQNCYTYNFYGGGYLTNKNKVNWVANVWENPSSNPTPYALMSGTTCNTGNCPPSGDTDWTGTEVYAANNRYNGSAISVTGTPASYTFGSLRFNTGYTPLPYTVVKDSVLTYSGARARMEGVDALDQYYKNSAINLTDIGYPTSEGGSIVLPSLAAGTLPPDDDNDGLDNAYELAQTGGASSTSVSPTARPAYATVSKGVIDQTGVTNYATTAWTNKELQDFDKGGYWNLYTFAGGGGGGPTCSDGIQNGDETGIDCGGSCAPCGGGPTGTGNKSAKRKGIIF